MRTIKFDLEFLVGILQENRLKVFFGGVAAIAAGVLLAKMSMVFVGGFLILVASIEYVITLLFQRS